MGCGEYSVSSAIHTRTVHNYASKSADQIFEQNIKKRIHESMDPKDIKIREARDSETHPNSVPMIVSLDVTGSMGSIPMHLIRDGLPHMMGNIIQHGTPDPALLFLAVGDTVYDEYPLQVGQFESGDKELDTWLTRTYLEGGGGANIGESYLLAWYFAAFHTVTDAWEKRGQKGFLFTIGDEPCLNGLPMNALKGLMNHAVGQSGYTDVDLLKAAKEKWNVYHLHIMEGAGGARSLDYWKGLMGQNCITVDNHMDVSRIIAEIVVEHTEKPVKTDALTDNYTPVSEERKEESSGSEPKITL